MVLQLKPTQPASIPSLRNCIIQHSKHPLDKSAEPLLFWRVAILGVGTTAVVNLMGERGRIRVPRCHIRLTSHGLGLEEKKITIQSTPRATFQRLLALGEGFAGL